MIVNIIFIIINLIGDVGPAGKRIDAGGKLFFFYDLVSDLDDFDSDLEEPDGDEPGDSIGTADVDDKDGKGKSHVYADDFRSEVHEG